MSEESFESQDDQCGHQNNPEVLEQDVSTREDDTDLLRAVSEFPGIWCLAWQATNGNIAIAVRTRNIGLWHSFRLLQECLDRGPEAGD